MVRGIRKVAGAVLREGGAKAAKAAGMGREEDQTVLAAWDIWYGNIAERAGTDEPIMFDPAAFWAHNECTS